MSDFERLKLLTSQMTLEPSGGIECPQLSSRKGNAVGVSHAMLPNGQRIALLKTLLSSVCEHNCNYCPFRSDRDVRRASFTPDEFARVFMYMHQAGIVEGIFLSSGVVGGGVKTQDKLLATAEILRHKYHYRDYLHLKIMPGAEKAQVEASMLLADRVSVNLEAPNAGRLEHLAPEKRFDDQLLAPLRWIDEIRREQRPHKAWKGRWPSSVTQFVVGGADESDLELLSTTAYLHQQAGLGRAYFSAFSPVPETPLEQKAPTPLRRQNRLYQASFLLRDYGFDLEELPFQGKGDLSLETDPKLAWAQQNLAAAPMELNTASRRDLLRVPGVGPKSADTLLAARRQNKLRSLSQLKKLGIQAEKAKPFILLDGKAPARQLRMF
jgi:predicted DNA-binding helix-hairpin-helix protein